jgi:transcriptional regulator with XRE-family HTH domain
MANKTDELLTNPHNPARAGVARILGRRLRYFRSQMNVTQQTIAETLRTDRSYVSRLERGKVLPRLSTLVKLANYFGVDVSTLLSNRSASNRGKNE